MLTSDPCHVLLISKQNVAILHIPNPNTFTDGPGSGHSDGLVAGPEVSISTYWHYHGCETVNFDVWLPAGRRPPGVLLGLTAIGYYGNHTLVD